MASTGNPMNAGGALSGEAEEGGARDSMGGKWREYEPWNWPGRVQIPALLLAVWLWTS